MHGWPCADSQNLDIQSLVATELGTWEMSQGVGTGMHLIVQDEFPNWIQGYPMKTKDTSERIVRLQRFTALFSESRDKFVGLVEKVDSGLSRSAVES